jgi:murein DD-endopeptidase MepM/ murein hydrolase activator NlpD
MKKIAFLSSFFLSASLLPPPSLLAQRPVVVSYSEDAQGNINFSCFNKAYCNYVLQVDFTKLNNAASDHPLPFQAVVKPGNTKLFKLTKQQPADPIQLNYKIAYFKGCLDARADTGFTYLLPLSPGKSSQAYQIDVLTKTDPQDPEIKKAYAVRLRMQPGDTIYAARRGTVTEVDVSSDLNDNGVPGAHAWNYIEIVHADCSFGQYGIIKKDGAFVHPGQVVEAGQPIGLVGGDKFGRGSDIRFAVYYNQPGDKVIYRFYVPLKFWTKKNGKGMLKHGATYTSEFPKNLLSLETPHHPAAKPKSHRS